MRRWLHVLLCLVLALPGASPPVLACAQRSGPESGVSPPSEALEAHGHGHCQDDAVEPHAAATIEHGESPIPALADHGDRASDQDDPAAPVGNDCCGHGHCGCACAKLAAVPPTLPPAERLAAPPGPRLTRIAALPRPPAGPPLRPPIA
jgi:hypothetical protein